MLVKKWEKLPQNLQCDSVRPYYEKLRKKNFSLFFKRVFDIFVSSIMLILLSLVFLILALAIKIDSRGPVFSDRKELRSTAKLSEFSSSELWWRARIIWARR